MHKQTAVTNVLSCCSSPGAVRPNPLTTAPVPFRKNARPSRAAFLWPNDRRPSASGSATVVSLRLRSRRLSASASLFRSPNRWPKQNPNENWIVFKAHHTCHNICAVFVTVRSEGDGTQGLCFNSSVSVFDCQKSLLKINTPTCGHKKWRTPNFGAKYRSSENQTHAAIPFET